MAMHHSTPWQVLSSSSGVGVLTEGWVLDKPNPGGEPRLFAEEITFASPFSSPPVVHIGLTGFDMDQRDSARITLKAEDITPTGFKAVIATWDDTRVFSVEFNWLAIGS